MALCTTILPYSKTFGDCGDDVFQGQSLIFVRTAVLHCSMNTT
jgi:hypothetical protein